MTWVRQDDKLHRNAKQLRMTDGAFRVWVLSWSYCAEEKALTGFMTYEQALSLIRGLGKPKRVVNELIRLNAWEHVVDGYLIHDFEKYLDEGSAKRTRKWREAKRIRDASVTSHNGGPETDGDVTVTQPRARRDTPIPGPGPEPVPEDLDVTSGVESLDSLPLPPLSGNGSKDPEPTTNEITASESWELIKGWHDLNGGRHSPKDQDIADRMVGQFRRPPLADMVQQLADTVERLERQTGERPRSLTHGGFWKDMVWLDHKRAEAGKPTRDAEAVTSRRSGLQRIGEIGGAQ